MWMCLFSYKDPYMVPYLFFYSCLLLFISLSLVSVKCLLSWEAEGFTRPFIAVML